MKDELFSLCSGLRVINAALKTSRTTAASKAKWRKRYYSKPRNGRGYFSASSRYSRLFAIAEVLLLQPVKTV